MNNKRIKLAALLSIISLALIMNGCKEVGPNVPWGNTHALSDTSYVESPVQSRETKNVLVEMFTGVSCINCPQGHLQLEGMETSSGGRIIGVAMHSTAEPAAQDESVHSTTQLLGCSDAQTIVDNFIDIGFRPMASVDRVQHTNTFSQLSIYDDRGNWSGYGQTQLTLSTPVNLNLTRTYNATSKLLTISAELHYIDAQTDSQKLTLFLTEDSIISGQLNGAVEDSFYVHNAVLRAAVTNPLGDKMNVNILPGTVIRRIYQYTITNPVWKPEHMHIVGFVHKAGNPPADILQTKIISLK